MPGRNCVISRERGVTSRLAAQWRLGWWQQIATKLHPLLIKSVICSTLRTLILIQVVFNSIRSDMDDEVDSHANQKRWRVQTLTVERWTIPKIIVLYICLEEYIFKVGLLPHYTNTRVNKNILCIPIFPMNSFTWFNPTILKMEIIFPIYTSEKAIFLRKKTSPPSPYILENQTNTRYPHLPM